MNEPIIVSESTLTDRYQTTVPEPIRKALHLHKREKIRYTIQSNGAVLLSRAEEGDTDPVINQFLTFLASDMTKHPERLQMLNKDLVSHVSSLVSDVDIDLDAPLSDEDE